MIWLPPKREIITRAPPKKQRGFLLNPYRFGGGGGGPTDPDFSSVVALLPMDGTEGSTSFPDSSPLGLTWTATGSNVAVRTAQSKWGGASAGFGAVSAGYISATDSGLVLGTGDFTAELWFRRTASLGGYNALYIFGSADKGLYMLNDNFLFYDVGQVGSFATTVDTWHFFQVTRTGTTISVRADGVEIATATRSTDYTSTTHRIGANLSGGEQLYNAYVDDARCTKGIARANVVPTAAFPDS